jgi:DivIVA domain-containing protein
MTEDFRLTASDIASKSFPITRKGFDQSAVKRYLEEIATEFIKLNGILANLRSELESLKSKEANQDIPEDKLYALLGQRAAKILEQAKHSADETIQEAEKQAAKIIQDAEGLLAKRAKEADEFAQKILENAKSEAENIKLETKNKQEEILSAAKTQGAQIISQAQEARNTILNDLADKRKLLRTQVEQLIAGKNVLLKTIDHAKELIEKLQDEINRSTSSARVAAESVSTKIALENEPSLDQLIELATEIQSSNPQLTSQRDTNEESSNEDTQQYEGIKILGAIKAEKLQAQQGNKTNETQELHIIDEIFSKLKVSSNPTQTEEQVTLSDKQESKPKTSQKKEDKVLDSPDPQEISTAETQINQSDEIQGLCEKLAPITAFLARKLKRVLSDQQNELLNRLRLSKDGSLFAGLIEPNEQFNDFVSIASEAFAQLVLIQKEFEKLQEVDFSQLNQELAKNLVESIRSKIFKDDVIITELIKPSLQELVSATYRELRSAKVDELSGDIIFKAYNLLVLHSCKDDELIIWQPTKQPCSDCEDNSLSEPIKPFSLFPTGVNQPPFHSGCRCILIKRN